jgi:hypothetical protein
MQRTYISDILSLFPDTGNSVSHETLCLEGLLKSPSLVCFDGATSTAWIVGLQCREVGFVNYELERMGKETVTAH